MHRIFVVSDIHYAGPAEKQRGCRELDIIPNPLLRLTVRAYRHYIWRRDPFAHNSLLDSFLEKVLREEPDLVVGNGDYSCDTAFVGVGDEAAFQSADECLGKLRRQADSRVLTTIGDHELGKMSLFGGEGGMRLLSFSRATKDLALEPFWKIAVGRNVLLGITSSLVALPVYSPETLPEERKEWNSLREDHLALIRQAFLDLKPEQRVVLFLHDPTALPFLWEEPAVQRKAGQIAKTIIGHLHSKLFLRKSFLLAGMPSIRFLGNSIRRMSVALNRARCWRSFHVELCPSLAGIELLKDGGFLELRLDPDGKDPVRCRVHPMKG